MADNQPRYVERRVACPERIIEMVGSAFGVGCCGGFCYNLATKWRDYPKGHRFAGAFAAAQTRAPQLATTFAMWSGIFHAFECVIEKRHGLPSDAVIRSPLDAGACGFLTAGLLSIRFGARAASTNAVVGGVCVLLVDQVMGRH
eukprot:TRINITY_DN33619_c0_g1_i1.p1 TRINITY_DN33619_c0_g1~~TRINITY_DN33619_c0_g1_i1.p1  ORF type:complete len:144 (-),score=9.94 TRINITY_DN33619_c0_g1_i1:76-507(-)